MNNPSGKDTTEVRKADSPNVEPWFLSIMASVTAIDVTFSLPLPIQIKNHMLCVNFCLGLRETPVMRMCMLLDSRVAMNSGNKGRTVVLINYGKRNGY